MKFGEGRVSHTRYGMRRRLPFLTGNSKFRGLSMMMLFCALTLSFNIYFSTITEGAKVTSYDRKISTVSAKGKRGASSPPGVVPQENTKPKENPGALANKPKLPLSIPAKHPWVTKPLYTDPYNGAAQYLAENPAAPGAAYIARMSQVPVAQWFGDWNGDVRRDADAYVSAAAATGKIPVLVAYNIPLRDCGGYSVGGAGDVTGYTQWVQQFAAGIGNRTAVVILEPDALAAVDCLPASAQQDRFRSIAQAVPILKANPQTAVYIDAGTPVWQSTTTMASRLKSANVTLADGFSLNVSYFATTSLNRTYGDKLSSLIGYKHYVVDTSRNGGNNAVTGMQCNPSFASFGQMPTTSTGSALNDALLWIKIPWESDGECNGNPGPGQNYWSYAIKLAQNAGW